MNAYHLSMMLIILNLSFLFIASMNMFPQNAEIIHGHDVNAPDVNNTLSQVANIFAGTGAGGILGALVGLIGVAATRSWSPVALGLFSGVFWGSVIDTTRIVNDITSFMGVVYFSVIFITIAMFIYVATIVQILSGGMKAYE